ncbi:hypothetical protein CEXT_248381 [Caerostris extrusa]|uniref:Uncharacterized protein n=1 Tax=Caerostris extrusa TaxID=172846 RepID=A0AAV4MEM3_CAEEX|nr:hypothetical protein CEXT_248381 [Caerostris extrusa]
MRLDCRDQTHWRSLRVANESLIAKAPLLILLALEFRGSRQLSTVATASQPANHQTKCNLIAEIRHTGGVCELLMNPALQELPPNSVSFRIQGGSLVGKVELDRDETLQLELRAQENS